MTEKLAVSLHRIATAVNQEKIEIEADALYLKCIESAKEYAKMGTLEYKLYPKNNTAEALLKVKARLIEDGFACSLHDANYGDDTHLSINWDLE